MGENMGDGEIMTMQELLKRMHQQGIIPFPCIAMVTGRKETNRVTYLDYDHSMTKEDWIKYLNAHQDLIGKGDQLYIVTARSHHDFDSSMYPQDIKDAKDTAMVAMWKIKGVL